VDLARWQFAIVASYHFLFVPLTLGLAWMLFTMECAYVRTRNPIYKDMTRFWGKLFGINFAVGVLSGLTMEFQFGTNWAFYSQYVGDIFGTPLAIEGLVAFMLESTFLGLFFFGWDKLSPKQHLFATFCLAIGSSLSALLILVANGFMQHPVGAHFNPATFRMETTNLMHLFMNPLAQIGFAHTVIAGYVTGAIFVLGISGYYLLRGRDVEFAKRSFAIAAGFGVVASIMVILMGDQNGLAVFKSQPEKLAAIEAEWTTQAPPASFNLIAVADQKAMKNDFAIRIPDVLGVLVTHSWNATIPGLQTLLTQNEVKVRDGAKAYVALEAMRAGTATAAQTAVFNANKADLGYGLLLLNYTHDMANPSQTAVFNAAFDTLPNVNSLFWTFRIMVLLGFFMFALFVVSLILVTRDTAWKHRWLMRTALYALPAPFLANLCGWFVAEHGRQPWTIYGVLPTSYSASTLSAFDIGASLTLFILFYALLYCVELYLMFRFGRKGPSALHTGRYHFENQHAGK
jgi:cytochrome d ubiquinol oxidase subunit I